MHRIPGGIIGVGVMDIARCRRRDIDAGFARRRPVIPVPTVRPVNGCCIAPAAMMRDRSGEGRPAGAMRRGNATMSSARCRECLACRKHKRQSADRRDKQPKPWIRHGITNSYATEQYCGTTLGRIAGARKPIINGWLTGNITGEPAMVYGGPGLPDWTIRSCCPLSQNDVGSVKTREESDGGGGL